MEMQLSTEAQQFLAEQVASGRYPSEAAALEEAVRLLRRRDSVPQAAAALDAGPLWGLFRDEPELMDRIVAEALDDRRNVPLRARDHE
jgi:Arc/MetJ-type ribon-helix-helix transcriptional regulator